VDAQPTGDANADVRRTSADVRGDLVNPQFVVLVAGQPPMLTASAAPVLLRILAKAVEARVSDDEQRQAS
jgi:hypothetical protein